MPDQSASPLRRDDTGGKSASSAIMDSRTSPTQRIDHDHQSGNIKCDLAERLQVLHPDAMRGTSPLKSILLGTAVGDSIGLPAEGLSPQTIKRRWRGTWRQRLIFGSGMVSDDTEHSVFVAQSLAAASSEAGRFQHLLAWRFRYWICCLPAGVGLATLRASLKLCLGVPPAHSGVYSAGNGPAMRSALIGAFFVNEPAKIREFVRVSTRITHTDPRAETAALAIALTAAHCLQSPPDAPNDLVTVEKLWRSAGPTDSEWQRVIDRLIIAAEQGWPTASLANDMGLYRGVSGYAYHTVPIALYSWYLHLGDFRRSVEAVLNLGGDTDTCGAIVGALAAIRAEIPEEWVNSIRDYPVSCRYLSNLGDALARAGESMSPTLPSFAWLAMPVRNLVFLGIILVHGFRRLVPL